MAPHDGYQASHVPHEMGRVYAVSRLGLAILSRETSGMSHLGKPLSRDGVICNIRSESG
jgi:hypothetical protein